jgi:hypothetical protein
VGRYVEAGDKQGSMAVILIIGSASGCLDRFLLCLICIHHPSRPISFVLCSRPGTPDAAVGPHALDAASPGVLAMLLNAEEAKERLEASLAESQASGGVESASVHGQGLHDLYLYFLLPPRSPPHLIMEEPPPSHAG